MLIYIWKYTKNYYSLWSAKNCPTIGRIYRPFVVIADCVVLVIGVAEGGAKDLPPHHIPKPKGGGVGKKALYTGLLVENIVGLQPPPQKNSYSPCAYGVGTVKAIQKRAAYSLMN